MPTGNPDAITTLVPLVTVTSVPLTSLTPFTNTSIFPLVYVFVVVNVVCAAVAVKLL